MKKTTTTAKSRQNRIVAALEQAQTDIRFLIKNAYLTDEPQESTNYRLQALINKAVKGISILRLRQDARRSLYLFASRQYRLWRSLKIKPPTLFYLGVQASKGFPLKTAPSTTDLKVVGQIKGSNYFEYETRNKGLPLSSYYKDVWEKQVKPTLERLTNTLALDPNDYTGRNSLRNLAEMEVRYNEHLQEISDFKSNGVKLVIASAHADCSGRCSKWQGKVYSLDGSYGTTEDGREYQPLENATDVYYTTKAGRTYKNGLLGFNCRHKLHEFNGQQPQTISKEDRKKEYAITLKQRQMERAVRKKRVEALMLKDIDKVGYQKAKTQARNLYVAYKNYSHENARAYYPMRISI